VSPFQYPQPVAPHSRLFSKKFFKKNHSNELVPSPRQMAPPPVVALRSLPRVHVLRDYESCVLPGVCGNKARKLAALVSMPQLPAEGQLVSHGGPQSNAMLALARIAAARGGRLTYHTTPLPRWLRDAPSGNLASALACGMQLCEHPTRQAYADACAAAAANAERQAPPGGSTSWVERGGACPDAEVGVAGLAEDVAWWLVESTAAAPSTRSHFAPGESPPLHGAVGTKTFPDIGRHTRSSPSVGHPTWLRSLHAHFPRSPLPTAPSKEGAAGRDALGMAFFGPSERNVWRRRVPTLPTSRHLSAPSRAPAPPPVTPLTPAALHQRSHPSLTCEI
jgi:hypothetical protein